jgi:hypothetical protein
MAIDVRKVTDRRSVHFDSIDALLADAERLVQLDTQGRVRPLGNMSLGQALGHLALWMHASIDGVPMAAPGWLKVGARLMKGQVLSRTLPAGYKLPPEAAGQLIPPASITAAEGFNKLSAAAARLNREGKRAPSPMLGTLTPDEWDRLHLRHAELHLSFMQVEDKA